MKLLSIFGCLLPMISFAQGSSDKVKWDVQQEWLNDSTTIITFNATIDEGWHMYGTDVDPSIGPIPTSFNFNDSLEVTPLDTMWYTLPHKGYDDAFMANLSYYENKAIFKQTYVIGKNDDKDLRVEVEFMVCGDGVCLPPEVIEIPIQTQNK